MKACVGVPLRVMFCHATSLFWAGSSGGDDAPPDGGRVGTFSHLLGGGFVAYGP